MHNLYSSRENCYHPKTAVRKYLQYLELNTSACAPRTHCWKQQHLKKRTIHTGIIYLWSLNSHCHIHAIFEHIHLCSKGDWVTLASLVCILKYQPWKYKRTGELVHKLQKENRDYELQLNFVGLDNPGWTTGPAHRWHLECWRTQHHFPGSQEVFGGVTDSWPNTVMPARSQSIL